MDPGEAQERGRGIPGLGFLGVAGCEPRARPDLESPEKNKAAMPCQMADGRLREGAGKVWRGLR